MGGGAEPGWGSQRDGVPAPAACSLTPSRVGRASAGAGTRGQSVVETGLPRPGCGRFWPGRPVGSGDTGVGVRVAEQPLPSPSGTESVVSPSGAPGAALETQQPHGPGPPGPSGRRVSCPLLAPPPAPSVVLLCGRGGAGRSSLRGPAGTAIPSAHGWLVGARADGRRGEGTTRARSGGGCPRLALRTGVGGRAVRAR